MARQLSPGCSGQVQEDGTGFGDPVLSNGAATPSSRGPGGGALRLVLLGAHDRARSPLLGTTGQNTNTKVDARPAWYEAAAPRTRPVN